VQATPEQLELASSFGDRIARPEYGAELERCRVGERVIEVVAWYEGVFVRGMVVGQRARIARYLSVSTRNASGLLTQEILREEDQR